MCSICGWLSDVDGSHRFLPYSTASLFSTVVVARCLNFPNTNSCGVFFFRTWTKTAIVPTNDKMFLMYYTMCRHILHWFHKAIKWFTTLWAFWYQPQSKQIGLFQRNFIPTHCALSKCVRVNIDPHTLHIEYSYIVHTSSTC